MLSFLLLKNISWQGVYSEWQQKAELAAQPLKRKRKASRALQLPTYSSHEPWENLPLILEMEVKKSFCRMIWDYAWNIKDWTPSLKASQETIFWAKLVVRYHHSHSPGDLGRPPFPMFRSTSSGGKRTQVHCTGDQKWFHWVLKCSILNHEQCFNG